MTQEENTYIALIVGGAIATFYLFLKLLLKICLFIEKKGKRSIIPLIFVLSTIISSIIIAILTKPFFYNITEGTIHEKEKYSLLQFFIILNATNIASGLYTFLKFLVGENAIKKFKRLVKSIISNIDIAPDISMGILQLVIFLSTCIIGIWFISAYVIHDNKIHMYIFSFIIFMLLIRIPSWGHAKALLFINDESLNKREWRLVTFYITLAIIPFKTVIYIFYLLLTIIAYLKQEFVINVSEGLSLFLNANQYTIVLLIAVDRIKSSFMNEKISNETKHLLFQILRKRVTEF